MFSKFEVFNRVVEFNKLSGELKKLNIANFTEKYLVWKMSVNDTERAEPKSC